MESNSKPSLQALQFIDNKTAHSTFLQLNCWLAIEKLFANFFVNFFYCFTPTPALIYLFPSWID